MQNHLENKVVVLTGAGGGIGRAVAEKLAAAKAKLILLGGNNIAKLEATAEIVKKHTSCTLLPGDLCQAGTIDGAFRKIADEYSGIDILINNAGTAQNTSFEEISIAEFDRIMQLNVRVPFMLIQAALPYLKKSSYAAIVNIASVVAHAGYPNQSIYTASKHALLGMTKSIAAEYFKDNIRVHAVSPGGVYTDMVKIARPDLTGEGMIMPEDIADIVHFLLANRTNAVIDEILVHRAGKEPFLV